MSDAFANWLWDVVNPVVFVGVAFTGVSSLVYILISRFKRVSPREADK